VQPVGYSNFLDSTRVKEDQFKKSLRRAGLADMHLHDLRHSTVTILLAKGVNIKVISELLGHSDITITLRVYDHLLPTM